MHIDAGAAGLALALLLGKRHGWPHRPTRPHNLPLVLLGAGLLWFGWYGFDAGSGLFGGGWRQLGKQAVAALAVACYSFAVSYAIGWVIHKTLGFRISTEGELTGIDESLHAEGGYDLAGITSRGRVATPAGGPLHTTGRHT